MFNSIEPDQEGFLGLMQSKFTKKVEPNKSIFPSLSLATRIKGWAICMILGYFVSMMSSNMLKTVLNGKILKFAILYFLGTILSLSSSLFLWGPKAQCQSMFDKTRRITTILFMTCITSVLVCIILTIAGHEVHKLVFLTLITFQSCIYFWYCLSFIPYGRTVIKKIARTTFSC